MDLIKTFERVNKVSVPLSFSARRSGDVSVCFANTDLSSEAFQWKAKRTFEENSLGESLPSVGIKFEKGNINIVDLVILSKAESSKSEIRRLIKGKGIKINNEIVYDEKFIIEKKSFDKNNLLKLSICKKKHIKIKLS